ncbi:MAG: dTDP-4-dehydrorhamnose reductase [Verrucomicrobia bacterium]|nr:dTDP-4-dehydrorhamnose reductase [Verrucomicrobiota bacterium]
MKQKIGIVGKNGRLGAALCRALADTYEVLPFGRRELDLMQPVREQLKGVRFDLLINAAAATNVDWCESHESDANQINARAVGELGALCAERDVRCLHVSTDYVFDGLSSRPYIEEDPALPINVYGKSKRLGEELLLQICPDHLAIRVSWMFGPDKASFVDWVLDQALSRDTVSAIDDKTSSPTYSLDFVRWIRPLLFELPIGGILHLCNPGGCTWREFAQWAIDTARFEGVRLKAREVQPITLDSMSSFLARRPLYTVLAIGKFLETTGLSARPWRDAVQDFVRKKFSGTQ